MNIKEFWGVFIGLIIGYGISKIYLIWAMLFRTYGLGMARINRWEGTPLWEAATKNPDIFTLLVVVIFSIIGLVFVRTQQNKEV